MAKQLKTRAELHNMVYELSVIEIVDVLDNQQKLIDLHEKIKQKQDLTIKLQSLKIEMLNTVIDHYKGSENA